MRIHELITEAPASRLGQLGRRVGAAALGAVGAKGFAGQLSGSADAKKWANRYYDEFSRFLGQTGKRMNNATSVDMRDFFNKSRLPTDHIDNGDVPMTKQDIIDVLSTTAQDYFRGRSTPKQKTRAPAAAPAADGPAADGQAAPNQPTTPSELVTDKFYKGSDGKSYKWLGAQWQDSQTGRTVSASADQLANPQPETPEQTRLRRQTAATRSINRTASTVRTAPSTPPVAV